MKPQITVAEILETFLHMKDKLSEREKEAVIAAVFIIKDHAALTHRLKQFVKDHAFKDSQETHDLPEDLLRG